MDWSYMWRNSFISIGEYFAENDSARERVVSFARLRNSAEELANVVNWSHIDGLFDLILTIGKQTLIETDEHVRLSDWVRFLSHSNPSLAMFLGRSRGYSNSLSIVFSFISDRSTISGSSFFLPGENSNQKIVNF